MLRGEPNKNQSSKMTACCKHCLNPTVHFASLIPGPACIITETRGICRWTASIFSHYHNLVVKLVWILTSSLLASSIRWPTSTDDRVHDQLALCYRVDVDPLATECGELSIRAQVFMQLLGGVNHLLVLHSFPSPLKHRPTSVHSSIQFSIGPCTGLLCWI